MTRAVGDRIRLRTGNAHAMFSSSDPSGCPNCGRQRLNTHLSTEVLGSTAVAAVPRGVVHDAVAAARRGGHAEEGARWRADGRPGLQDAPNLLHCLFRVHLTTAAGFDSTYSNQCRHMHGRVGALQLRARRGPCSKGQSGCKKARQRTPGVACWSPALLLEIRRQA